MVESVGKKLIFARKKLGLSIEEAAHATKLRPDKISALEGDDYSQFANDAYARGFLNIYARYLNVDVSSFARTLSNAKPISVDDYQYLSNGPLRGPERPSTVPSMIPARRPPSVLPIIASLFLIGAGLVFMWAYANYQRIVGTTPTVEKIPAAQSASEIPAPRPIAPIPTPGNPDTAPALVENAAPAIAETASSPAPPPILEQSSSATAATTTSEEPAGPDRDFVVPTPVATPEVATAAVNGRNEVLVASLRKTWVTIRKDDPKAPPIFEDYLWPDAMPLRLKGARFFVEARDPSAVQITKNGLPFAYQSPGVPIQ